MGTIIMAKIDVIDEAIIDAKPEIVFNALLDEFEGAKNWWMPDWEAKIRGHIPFRQVGGIIDITVHRIGTPKWKARSVEIVPNKLLKADFFEGDFIGSGEWNLEQLNGKTKVSFRFNIETNRFLYSMMYPLVKRIHSGVMKNGFKSLNIYLKKK
jgi:uncharacterized protein YndB with AHSA1/START domain